jgi:phosphoribosylformylglycinamidine cyclo-ligase
MCVNDAICCGAEPLFFLDYVAMGKDDPGLLEKIVAGISNGCLQADCALLGGETAIMPDMYSPGEYDLAGFCVGVVEKPDLIDGSTIVPGDVVIGVASNGIHSNGYSLVRKIVFDAAGRSIDDRLDDGHSIGEELLRPTAIYVRAVRDVLKNYKVKKVVHGIAHITGGGIAENIQRILPGDVEIEIDSNSWPQPGVFNWLKRLGNVEPTEMNRVFNMGIGLAIIVNPFYADSIRRVLAARAFDSWVIGKATAGEKSVRMIGSQA